MKNRITEKLGEEPISLLKLIQFWDAHTPPDEIIPMMKSWSSDRTFEYYRYDYEKSANLIEENFDKRVLSAFRQCAIPAMQADLFRYCALYVHGGIYIDADTENGGQLSEFIKKSASYRGLLMRRNGNIANDFIFLRNSGDPLMERTINTAVENISKRGQNNVWAVTGPGIFTSLYADPREEILFRDLPIIPVEEVRRHVLFRWNLEYKKRAADWRNAAAMGTSIYQDATE